MHTAPATPPPLPFCGKIGRTFCATIASTLPWPRAGTAASEAPIRITKNFRPIHFAILTAQRMLAMLLEQSAQQRIREASRSRRALAAEKSANPEWVRQHAGRGRYPNPLVTFSVGVLIIRA
jgi:hypothetical protein